MNPIILDRSRLEQLADCPQKAQLSIIFDALSAEAKGLEVFDWERKLVDAADRDLIEKMKAVCLQSNTGRIAECGTQIHELVEQAFTACEGDLSSVPEWFVDNLPSIRPDIQPMAIRHARHIGDMLADFHVGIIGVEKQLSVEILPETQTRPAVVGTMRYDVIGVGKHGDSLHVFDWKTGYKRRSNTEAFDSFQAQFGAWLLWQQQDYREIQTIHFWYYETLFGTKAYAKFVRDDEHPRLPGLTTMAAITGRVRQAVELFIKGDTSAWPMPDKCCWCEMIRFCRLANMEAKEIADDSKTFIDKLVTDEASLKRRKKAATDWVKAKGALCGTKVAFTRKMPAERFTADFEDIEKPKSGATGDDELDGHFK